MTHPLSQTKGENERQAEAKRVYKPSSNVESKTMSISQTDYRNVMKLWNDSGSEVKVESVARQLELSSKYVKKIVAHLRRGGVYMKKKSGRAADEGAKAFFAELISEGN